MQVDQLTKDTVEALQSYLNAFSRGSLKGYIEPQEWDNSIVFVAYLKYGEHAKPLPLLAVSVVKDVIRVSAKPKDAREGSQEFDSAKGFRDWLFDDSPNPGKFRLNRLLKSLSFQ